jgi:hypothetical protein
MTRPTRPERPGDEIRTTDGTLVDEPEPVPSWLRLQSSPPADVIVRRCT